MEAAAADAPVMEDEAAAAPALAHVRLEDAGAAGLEHDDLSLLCYDDAAALLLAVKGGHVFAHAAAAGGALRWMYPLQPGPPPLALKPGLDGRVLAAQRGPSMLELADLATGGCSVASTYKGRDRILGFFFSEAPGVDLVVVTDRGVEMHAFAPKRQGLKLVSRVRRRSDWCLYTHETRMLVAGTDGATPAAPPVLSAWQFAAAGIVHLPLFELRGPLPAAAAAAREFLGAPPPPPFSPPPSSGGGNSAEAAAAAADGPTWAAAAAAEQADAAAAAAAGATTRDPLLTSSGAAGDPCGVPRPPARQRLWLLRMYGRVYLAHAVLRVANNTTGGGGGGNSSASPSPAAAAALAVPPARAVLELYRFYSDTLLLERVIDLASPRVELSVVDNALVLHYPMAGVAAVADVCLPGRAPFTAPLPLRRPPSAPAAGPRVPRGGAEAPHGQGWRYLAPDVVLDLGARRLYRLRLDLAGIADSAASDWPALIAFLARRRPLAVGPAAAPAPAPAPGGDPRALLVAACRAALTDCADLGELRRVFGALAEVHAAAAAAAVRGGGGSAGGGGGSAGGAGGGSSSSSTAAPPAPSCPPPSELADALFCWAAGEEVVDAPYLQAAAAEYAAAAEAAGAQTPPALACLAVELLLQQGAAAQALALLRAQPSALGLPLANRLAGTAGGGRGNNNAATVAAAAAGSGGVVAEPPGPLAREMALDVLSRQAAAEARAAARSAHQSAGSAAAAAPAAAAAAATPAARQQQQQQAPSLVHTETYARALMASGRALRAARLARDRGLLVRRGNGSNGGGGFLPPPDLLSAAASAGDARLYAALYRLCGGGGGGGGGGDGGNGTAASPPPPLGEGVEAAMRRCGLLHAQPV